MKLSIYFINQVFSQVINLFHQNITAINPKPI